MVWIWSIWIHRSGHRVKTFELHVNIHQSISTTEKALNNQVYKMIYSDDIISLLSMATWVWAQWVHEETGIISMGSMAWPPIQQCWSRYCCYQMTIPTASKTNPELLIQHLVVWRSTQCQSNYLWLILFKKGQKLILTGNNTYFWWSFSFLAHGALASTTNKELQSVWSTLHCIRTKNPLYRKEYVASNA